MRDAGVPRILIATAESREFEPGEEGWLVRDADLASLVRLAEGRHPWIALDIDSIEGLNADAAGVRFAVERLGVSAVVSRRPPIALLARDRGVLGLVRVFAFDSTGLRRSLEPIAGEPGLGLVISPGIVLPYVEVEQRAVLPRPLIAHGLVQTPAQARRVLAVADSVVLRPDVAASAGVFGPGETGRERPNDRLVHLS